MCFIPTLQVCEGTFSSFMLAMCYRSTWKRNRNYFILFSYKNNLPQFPKWRHNKHLHLLSKFHHCFVTTQFLRRYGFMVHGYILSGEFGKTIPGMPKLIQFFFLFFISFESGDLGPGTIVGSAAFNLLVITAVCIIIPADNEVRQIKSIKVFIVTAIFSIFAYLWMLIVLEASSRDVIEVCFYIKISAFVCYVTFEN